jgi:hypothetical protein
MLGYFTVNTVVELICFLTSLVCLFNERNPFWKSFMYYLLVVYMVETTGIYLRMHRQSNAQLYSAFLIVECGMISFFFYHLYVKYRSRAALILFGWLASFMVFYTIELTESSFTAFPYKTAAFMSVFFVFASCYFYLLVIRDEKFRQLGSYPSFWMVNGILFYYFGGTACNIFYDYLVHQQLSPLGLSVRYIIYNVLNVLLYSCWSYAFICRYRQRNLYSSSL